MAGTFPSPLGLDLFNLLAAKVNRQKIALGICFFPKNHGISSHWWKLEIIPEPCEKQGIAPLLFGRVQSLILRVLGFQASQLTSKTWLGLGGFTHFFCGNFQPQNPLG